MKNEKDVLDKIRAAHGLSRVTSLRQDVVLEARMLLMKGPSMSLRFLFDFKNRQGRVEMLEKGRVKQICQESGGERVYWSTKTGKVALGPAKTPFDFVPQMQTGLIGLIALGETSDPVEVISAGRSYTLARRQAPLPMPMMQGRDEPIVVQSECVWTYIVGPDGTLLTERIVQSGGGKKVQQELSYGRFQTMDGVKVPTEIGMKGDQLPKMASVKLKARTTSINPTLAANDFKLP